MNTTEIKRELHEYIEEADDRLLNLIYGRVMVDKPSCKIPDWHKEITEERAADYELNPQNAISWDELRSKIENMK